MTFYRPTPPLEGVVFGRLTVISLIRQDPRRGAIWLCRCECGKLTEGIRYKLLSGRKKGCGCIMHAKTPPEIRFWNFVDKTVECPDPSLKGNCWIFTGGKTLGGYGTFGISRSETILAHIFSCAMVGKKRPTKEFNHDHLCRVRACVNPDHIEIVPQRVNLLRGASPIAKNLSKTHCPKGHPYIGENLRIIISAKGRMQRRCKACDSARQIARRLRLSWISSEGAHDAS